MYKCLSLNKNKKVEVKLLLCRILAVLDFLNLLNERGFLMPTTAVKSHRL